MYLFGQRKEQSSLDPTPPAIPTPFTFVFTQICTSDPGTSCLPPLLRLPAELRNNIYELVAKDQETLILSAGKIVLPPLGGVCRQIRAEMRGIFEQEVISNTALPIISPVVNFNFKPLFDWLDEHDRVDGQPATGGECVVRALDIWPECRPDLSLDPHIGNTASPEEDRLASLLLHNLTTTMNGWSSELDYHEAMFPWRQSMSPEQYKQSWGADNFRRHLNFRRERSGHVYEVLIIADETWDRFAHLDFASSKRKAFQNISSVQSDRPALYIRDMMYESTKSWGWMRTDVDQKLALMLGEACKSDCSEEGMDAVVATLDGSQGRFYSEWASWVPDQKWNLNIINLAVDEFSRMETELHTEKQYRLMIALLILEREVKRKRSQLALEDASISRPSNPTAEQSLGRDSSEDEFQELTVMMAEWHLCEFDQVAGWKSMDVALLDSTNA
jgi:hypothetical protein